MKANNEIRAYGDEDDNWIITFADLMSLLLAFFVLLFSFSSIDAQKYNQLKKTITQSFSVEPAANSPSDLENKGKAKAGSQALKLSNEIERFFTNSSTIKTAAEINVLSITRDKNSLILSLHDKFAFESSSARIKYESLPLILDIAQLLAKSSGEISVAGHTDSQPINTPMFHSNWHLSAARAAAITELLVEQSPSLSERITINAYADNRPVDSNMTEEGRSNNRRVDIIVMLDMSSLE